MVRSACRWKKAELLCSVTHSEALLRKKIDQRWKTRTFQQNFSRLKTEKQRTCVCVCGEGGVGVGVGVCFASFESTGTMQTVAAGNKGASERTSYRTSKRERERERERESKSNNRNNSSSTNN